MSNPYAILRKPTDSGAHLHNIRTKINSSEAKSDATYKKPEGISALSDATYIKSLRKAIILETRVR